MQFSTAHLVTWGIAGLATAGVIIRPFGWPEAIWAVAGAVLLVATGLVSVQGAGAAVGMGSDVYLFLIGMMLLSETARREGLFDHVAGIAVRYARSSPQRLFGLIYLVGIVVTVFLSNDATAVVLTPAVYEAAKRAKREPLPYLFVCAFIANAASFVLPISNPANIVLYGDHTPALAQWVGRFALPSILAIGATYALLRWVERDGLVGKCADDTESRHLSSGAWTALIGIGLTALVLLSVSALDWQLGLPTAIMGGLTVGVVVLRGRAMPWPILKGVSWGVLPLVAGLFVLVQGLTTTGVIANLACAMQHSIQRLPAVTPFLSGGLIGILSNLMNNLPAGLIARATVEASHPPQTVVDGLLIGVDLGPNLSVTGSLATILWLGAIRREGENVGFWRFLKVGMVVMPPALALALATRLLLPG